MIIKEYFKDNELACRCGCGLMPAEHAVESLYIVRILLNYPIIITSAARCKAHNAAVGGTEGSYHLECIAFDCKVPRVLELDFIDVAIHAGFNGVGVKDNDFIHIDLRPYSERAIWSY